MFLFLIVNKSVHPGLKTTQTEKKKKKSLNFAFLMMFSNLGKFWGFGILHLLLGLPTVFVGTYVINSKNEVKEASMILDIKTKIFFFPNLLQKQREAYFSFFRSVLNFSVNERPWSLAQTQDLGNGGIDVLKRV